MTKYASLQDSMKEYRRNFVDALDDTLDPNIIRNLAAWHTAILAIEAVTAEPTPDKTGPRIVFGPDGWPI